MANVRFEWFSGPSIQSGAISQAPMLDHLTTATTIATGSVTSVTAPAWASLVYVYSDTAGLKLSVTDTTPLGNDVVVIDDAGTGRWFGIKGGSVINTNNPA